MESFFFTQLRRALKRVRRLKIIFFGWRWNWVSKKSIVVAVLACRSCDIELFWDEYPSSLNFFGSNQQHNWASWVYMANEEMVTEQLERWILDCLVERVWRYMVLGAHVRCERKSTHIKSFWSQLRDSMANGRKTRTATWLTWRIRRGKWDESRIFSYKQNVKDTAKLHLFDGWEVSLFLCRAFVIRSFDIIWTALHLSRRRLTVDVFNIHVKCVDVIRILSSSS